MINLTILPAKCFAVIIQKKELINNDATVLEKWADINLELISIPLLNILLKLLFM